MKYTLRFMGKPRIRMQGGWKSIPFALKSSALWAGQMWDLLTQHTWTHLSYGITTLCIVLYSETQASYNLELSEMLHESLLPAPWRRHCVLRGFLLCTDNFQLIPQQNQSRSYRVYKQVVLNPDNRTECLFRVLILFLHSTWRFPEPG
jgi:hypothetical protein